MTPEEQWLAQREKVLAWLRLAFSLVAIAVVQLNPERAARFPFLSQLSLSTFVLYSLAVVYYTRRERPNSRKIGLATTCLDLIWITSIVFSTRGSRSPFFVFYLFPVITASSRYGVRGSLPVAAIGVVVYGFMRFSPIFQNPIDIDTFVVRSLYLLVIAYIFGFLSDFERKQNQKLMALYKTATEAATQEERRRIARELHDRLLQVLGSLTLRLEACRRHLLSSPKEIEAELALMEESTRSSIKEIRSFLSGKAVEQFTPGTLIERVREEMRFLRDRLGLRVILEVEPEDLTFPPDVEQQVYYVLKEALLNVRRHSQASELTLSLKHSEERFRACLKDNGLGFDQTPGDGSGYGIQSMRERIGKLGGDFSIKTAPGKGTEISFRVPLKE